MVPSRRPPMPSAGPLTPSPCDLRRSAPASGPEAYSVLASWPQMPALARHHTSARHERKRAFTQRDHFSTCLAHCICRARHVDVLLGRRRQGPTLRIARGVHPSTQAAVSSSESAQRKNAVMRERKTMKGGVRTMFRLRLIAADRRLVPISPQAKFDIACG